MVMRGQAGEVEVKLAIGGVQDQRGMVQIGNKVIAEEGNRPRAVARMRILFTMRLLIKSAWGSDDPTKASLELKNAHFATPATLVELVGWADKILAE